MVKRVFRALTAQVSGLQKAAFWLALFSILSILLGFLRDRILAYHFGAGESLDIYYAAFEIPDIIFVTVASLVSASILVPIFSEKKSNNESLEGISSSIFSSFTLLILAACAVAFIFMPQFVSWFFGSLGLEAAERAVYLSRILLLSPLFLGFSNFFSSIIQYEKRFLLYSLSPLLYNLGIIGGLLLGASKFGVIAAIYGVVFGAFLHMIVQAAFVFSSPESPKFNKETFSNLFSKEVRSIFYLSVPRTLSLSATGLVGFFFVSLASKLGSGSIAVFTLGFNLQSVLLSLIGSSYSLAAFPTLAEHYSKKDIPSLVKCMGEGMRHIIFWSLPATALFIILRAHIVRVVLGSGQFDWSDTRMTAAVLALFVFSVVFQSVSLFLTRAHYAFGKTKLPLIMNAWGAFSTVVIALAMFNFSFFSTPILNFLASILKVEDLSRISVMMLPISFSVGAIISASLLWLSLETSVRGGIRDYLNKTITDSIIGSLALSLAVVFALRIFNNFLFLDTALNVFLHGLASGVFGIAVCAAVLYLLKNRELDEVKGLFSRIKPEDIKQL